MAVFEMREPIHIHKRRPSIRLSKAIVRRVIGRLPSANLNNATSFVLPQFFELINAPICEACHNCGLLAKSVIAMASEKFKRPIACCDKRGFELAVPVPW